MRKSTILVLVLCAGCSSYFKRQECNKINWFEHGYKIAMSGQRINADAEIKQCEAAEAEISWTELDLGFKSGMANYCKADVVYATGKKGEFFNTDMCDSSETKTLKERHRQGVRIFCKSSNGFAVGASGKKYNQICPEDLEDGFVSQYQKGRKKYLTQQIQIKRREVRENSIKIRTLGNEKSRLEGRILQHNYRVPAKTIKVYDSFSKTTQEKRNEDYVRWENMDRELRQQKTGKASQIRKYEESNQQLKAEIDAMEVEKGALN